MPIDFQDLDIALAPAVEALAEAVAAGRPVILVGDSAPTGKLARRVPGLLGDDVPLRQPHHTVSVPGLIGGGKPVRQGEVALAHGGVLVLHDATEFNASALEGVRWVAKNGYSELYCRELGDYVRHDARFQIVLTAAPCPCGHHGNPARACICSPRAIERHTERLAKFRRDAVVIEVPRQAADMGLDPTPPAAVCPSTAELRKRFPRTV